MVARIAALGLAVAFGLACKIGRGDIVEEDLVVDSEELAVALRSMRFKRCKERANARARRRPA
jgi:hypothetical protein